MIQAPTKKDRIYETLKPYYKLEKVNKDDDTLVFESRFESGNLRKVIQTGAYEYDLILKPDYSTMGNTQWFYFKFTNTRKEKKYIFNIINMNKSDSLYNQGLKPLFYSTKDAADESIGWYRGATNICYFQNSIKKKSTSGNHYTLSFQFELKHDQDTVYLSHCYPYTYSDLLWYLKKICVSDTRDRIRKTALCQTLAGNDVPMLIITNFYSSDKEIAKRKSIILTGRVHPGESNSSFIMEGMIDFLVANDKASTYLRDNFVFKVVPMLNPDGVIIGNYRCSLSG